ncbi:MAG: hypothetical protein PHY72_02940 [Candidatus Pacebacteria bacterium]|nr:hypothetical protein [Candidatus Paceibacterota bacterium]
MGSKRKKKNRRKKKNKGSSVGETTSNTTTIQLTNADVVFRNGVPYVYVGGKYVVAEAIGL